MSAADNIYRIAAGRPMVSFGDIAQALGIQAFSLDVRLRDMPDATQPDTWKAGGVRMMMTDEAANWLAIHEKQYVAHLERVGQLWRLEKNASEVPE